MHLAQPGSLSLAAAFPHMHTDERAYYVSDSSLLSVAEELSAASPALMTLTTPTSGAHMLHRSIELTSTGQAVLRGELDGVVACDIDRWLGGVHLQRGVNMWRWDPARQRITAESSPF
jgi:hypothetical protein